MNKFLHLFSAILCFSIFFCPVVWAEGKKNVVFIRYRIAPTYFKTVVDGFKERMEGRGFIKGENINYIDVLTSSADRSSVSEVVEAVNKYKDTADMFITCGWVSMKTREILKDTAVPQLFVPVLESVALQMLPSVNEIPNTNLSGIYLMYPPEKIMRMARFILPAIKNYAYVYDSSIPADVIFKEAYKQLSPGKRYDIEIHYLDLAEGVDAVIKAMQEHQIEAYGGIVGSFKKRRELAVSGIPVITSYTLDITLESLNEYLDDTTLAGLFNPFNYCGEKAAEMTADIFRGIKTIEQTVPVPAKQIAFINMKAAKKLDKPVSFKMLETVDLVIQ